MMIQKIMMAFVCTQCPDARLCEDFPLAYTERSPPGVNKNITILGIMKRTILYHRSLSPIITIIIATH